MKKTHRAGVRMVGIVAVGALMLLSACAKSTTSNAGSGGSTGSTGSTGSSGSGGSGGSVTVSAKSVSGVGNVLVDSKGMTLYYLKTETPGNIMCTGSCATNWPPLLLPSGVTSATAGSGLDSSKLGTISRPDGGTQVTYDGKPLYLFIGDKSAGQATGQGVAGFLAVPVSGSSSGGGGGSTGGGGGGGGY